MNECVLSLLTVFGYYVT